MKRVYETSTAAAAVVVSALLAVAIVTTVAVVAAVVIAVAAVITGSAGILKGSNIGCAALKGDPHIYAGIDKFASLGGLEEIEFRQPAIRSPWAEHARVIQACKIGLRD
jgi:hypothetical protein